MQLCEQGNALEEHFPKSLHCFHVLLRTALPYRFILEAHLWGFGWIHSVSNLVSTRMVSPVVLMRREKSPGLAGWSVRPQKEGAPGGGAPNPASAGPISSVNWDSLSNHWCRMKQWVAPPFYWQQWMAKEWNEGGAVSHPFTHFVLSVVVHYTDMVEGSLVWSAVLLWRFQTNRSALTAE